MIGRAGDLIADGPGVAPQHAELLFRGGLVGVRDLGEGAGLWVEGQRVARRVLRPGLAFRVGGTRFELVEVTDGAPPDDVDDDDDDETLTFGDLETRLLDVRGGFGPQPAAAPGPARPIVDASAHERPSVVASPAVPPPAPRPARPAAMGQVPELPVVIAEADPNYQPWLRQAIARPSFVVSSMAEVMARVQQHPRLVVIVGYRLADTMPTALVDALRQGEFAERIVLLAVDGVARPGTELYYRVTPGMSPQDLAKVVASAVRPRRGAEIVQLSDTRAWHDKQVFDICAAVSMRPDPASAARAVEDGVQRIAKVSRVACVFHDAGAGALWTECDEAPIDGSAATGIVGFVARTGEPVHAPAVASDPRYDRSVDDPTGNGSEALLAVPVASRGEVHAVLVAVRPSVHGYFDERACVRLYHLARELGPIFARMSAAVNAEEVLRRRNRPGSMALFRPEAVQAYMERREDGEVIRIAPHWTRTMYWSLVAMLFVGIAGISIGSISEYSSGAAVIRQEGRTEVAVAGAGAIDTIDVEPGQRVQAGQVLVRLSDITERAEYDALRNEFRAQLRNRLLDPNDAAAASAVHNLERQLEAARAKLETRAVRAPHDGIVTDIGVDKGQHVGMGDAVMAVVNDKTPGLEVVAFLPGGDRPLIEPGMPLRLEMLGFDYAYQDLVVGSITEGVVGPAEAKRMLGPQLADTLPIGGGGVVMVRATLPNSTFESDGQQYPYHDGMGGTVEVRTRNETILEMLVPAFKEL